MRIATQQINPRLLRMSHFNGYEVVNTLKLLPRVCYDYEFEYYIKCDGGDIINGTFIPFKGGDVNIRKPGQEICGVAPYDCYIFCFSLDGSYTVPEGYIFGFPQSASPLFENPLLTLPDKVSLQNHPHICTLFQELYLSSQNNDELSQFKVNTLLYEILFELFQLTYTENRKYQSVNPRIIRTIEYIKNSFCDSINIMTLIKNTGLSKAYFNKCFKEYTSFTPSALILSLRMDKAKTLLCITNSPISEISSLCGYTDSVYFTCLFKKMTGVTPTQYRKLHNVYNGSNP